MDAKVIDNLRQTVKENIYFPDTSKFGTPEYMEEVAMFALSCEYVADKWCEGAEPASTRVTKTLLECVLPLIVPTITRG